MRWVETLRTLKTASPRAGARALDLLWGELCNQGSVSPDSAAAVPALVAFAAARGAPERDGILELLAGIAIGDHANFLDGSQSPARIARRPAKRRKETPSVEHACFLAVARAAPSFRAMLADRDARVRAAAAFVLAWLPDARGASAKAVGARRASERDAAARAAMTIALGHLGATRHRVAFVREVEDPKASALAKTAAAIAVVYIDRTEAPGAVRSALEAASTAKALRATRQPWNGGDLAGHAGSVLAGLPVRKTAQDGTIARLASMGYMAGDELAGRLVQRMFHGSGRKTAASLSAPQRALLEAVVDAGLLRSRGWVEHWLVRRGLPSVLDLPKFVGVQAGDHWELARGRR
jgi:hypothetical protein